MAVGPVGNMQFVAQNAALPSTQASNELAKESFASIANLAEFNAKEKAVEKLEKVAETEDIKNEVEEKNEEEKSQQNSRQNEENSEENLDENSTSDKQNPTHKFHQLDLSV